MEFYDFVWIKIIINCLNLVNICIIEVVEGEFIVGVSKVRSVVILIGDNKVDDGCSS